MPPAAFDFNDRIFETVCAPGNALVAHHVCHALKGHGQNIKSLLLYIGYTHGMAKQTGPVSR